MLMGDSKDGLLRPEPFWLDTAKSTRSVVRPTVVMTSVMTL
jgi:hypothetical protein